MLRHAIFCATLVAPACTCGDNTSPFSDAGAIDGSLANDGGPRSDAVAPLSFVDIAIGGCQESDAGLAACEGQSPLSLTFSAIAPSPIQVYLWNFGDGALSSAAAPLHVYQVPGLFTVSLDVEGPGGALGVTRPGAIAVTGAALGAACAADANCASDLCVCDPGDGPCAPGLANRGICSASCAVASPCASGTCIDLAAANPPAPEDWQRRLCLPDCGAGCADGLACRELLDASGSWTTACLPSSVLVDIGGGCADAGGAPDPHRCSSGQCVDQGARGLCAFGCSVESCPGSAECATFNGALGPQCLLECGAGSCASDPWLSCEQPGNGGPLGFTVPGAPSAGGYCAPEFCADAPLLDCAPDGQCVAGYCGP